MELFEKDFIKVKSKREAAEHLERCYGDFGWSLTEKKDDKLYYDTVHMAFSRPHGMPYKDELQLLQVRLELAFNKTGKYARKKPLNSLICVVFLFCIRALVRLLRCASDFVQKRYRAHNFRVGAFRRRTLHDSVRLFYFA